MFVNTTLQKIALSLFIIMSTVYIMHIGASMIVPIVFATLIAIFLYPLDRRVLKIVKFKSLSILISFIAVLLPISILGFLFYVQLSDIIDSLPAIGKNLQSGLDKILTTVSDKIPIINVNRKSLMNSESVNDITGQIGILGKGFVSTSSLLLAIFLTVIYTFFILYYRRSIKNFIIYQFESKLRPDIKETLTQIKEIVQSYLGGLGIVIIFLSIVNSIGLWIIGIEYPLFWGTLAGLLAVIPYVGTVLGGLLPFLFSLATYEHSWQPVAIIVFYGVIQFLEGNIITPKIVGDKVDINPLFAIMAVIVLSGIWGIPGTILALPLFGIFRIILSQFESTKPLATLMSSSVDEKVGRFKKLADSK